MMNLNSCVWRIYIIIDLNAGGGVCEGHYNYIDCEHKLTKESQNFCFLKHTFTANDLTNFVLFFKHRKLSSAGR